MKILIIGGTGLISSSITRQLLERGQDEVTLYNRGISTVRIPGGWKYIAGDRKNYAEFERQMAEAGYFDCVMDMIGFHPDEVASAVRAFRGRVGQYIFCSTVDVYTKPAIRYPYREDESQTGIGEYAVHKVLCEKVLQEAHEQGILAVTVIRPAYTYGEGGVIIHSFGWNTSYIDRIRKGKQIIVHGDGNSLWVACHVDDVARAFIHAAGNIQTLGKSYHTTGEEWMTWNQYHEGVAVALGAPKPQIVHIPSELLARIAPDRTRVCADNFQFSNIFDNTAAITDLNFQYTIPWIEGVKRTVSWLDAHHRIVNSDEDVMEDEVLVAWQRISKSIITNFTHA